MSDQDLEQQLAFAIRGLPDARAPHTLLPRVLAAVAARDRRAWYARPSATWSPLRQVSVVTASLVALFLVCGYAAPALLSITAERLAGMQAGWAAATLDGARGASRAADATTTVANIAFGLWRDYCAPLAIYASLLIVLLGGALAAFSTALGRLTQTRTCSR